ncbi:MAG: hypothetical protein HY690_06980 [Chloroflexi bacterium]|nr:hypothetical protein [Chloroflexota bacterium]
MRYRVAVYADDLGQWVHVGPVFTSREEAVRFLDTFATPFKRLVQLPPSEGVEEPQADPLAGLDRRRLEFVRFLVETGRLNESSEPELAPSRAA